ncbi:MULTISPECIES: tripartite tricarboxylate transporter substrate binding protein [unclassified Achromobacter]|uniref:Bug family tripartite tricarboxylate transporter substrate binding protein n=1 Tax=unclassified Achromobacter TaxID=2626865 RepID=UPI000B515934|nr:MULTISPECIES: tripartite tricarboxylate transporter substrate binding protein [unclassified Achromobacter]OWT70276.1 LacI family transcriptional regulator [Achromobacter sp. HZ34]OWT71816.1 LacI family transcriptional regulator [Achromobacter sp. HZ28]
MKILARLVVLLSVACAALPQAQAASYPDHPIHIILSTSPGGGADVTMRLLAPRLAERLGQSVVIENKPGGSGMIADSFVARSAPDGYTLLVDITTFTVNPALHKDMNFKPLEDLAPITQTARAANVLVVNPAVPVHNVKEFIEYAKKQKGAMTYASSGLGSSQHLAMEIFTRAADAPMTHVPYKGGGAAMADLLAGHVQSFFAFIPTASEHIKQGRLRPLATTGATRSASLPDLPTIAESGFPGFQSYDWNGMFAPAGTPPAIIDRLQQEMKAVLAEPDIQSRLKDLGLEPVASTPADFKAFLTAEIKKAQDIVQQANIKLD